MTLVFVIFDIFPNLERRILSSFYGTVTTFALCANIPFRNLKMHLSTSLSVRSALFKRIFKFYLKL